MIKLDWPVENHYWKGSPFSWENTLNFVHTTNINKLCFSTVQSALSSFNPTFWGSDHILKSIHPKFLWLTQTPTMPTTRAEPSYHVTHCWDPHKLCWNTAFNSLAFGRWGSNYKIIIWCFFTLILPNNRNYRMDTWYEIALRWGWIGLDLFNEVTVNIPQNIAYENSTSVQVMAWCHQATSHYLSQCWPSSFLP